jgi:hypothetical protein
MSYTTPRRVPIARSAFTLDTGRAPDAQATCAREGSSKQAPGVRGNMARLPNEASLRQGRSAVSFCQSQPAGKR